MPAEASQTSKRVFVTDCEGPISKNDNAFELAKSFVQDGDSFFALISKYDDVLADVVKKPTYKAGDTLRLILPFLKVYGATDNQIRDFVITVIILVIQHVTNLFGVHTGVPCHVSHENQQGVYLVGIAAPGIGNSVMHHAMY